MYKHVALTQTHFHTWPQTSGISPCSHSCHVISRLDIRHASTSDPAVSSFGQITVWMAKTNKQKSIFVKLAKSVTVRLLLYNKAILRENLLFVKINFLKKKDLFKQFQCHVTLRLQINTELFYFTGQIKNYLFLGLWAFVLTASVSHDRHYYYTGLIRRHSLLMNWNVLQNW